MDPSHSFMSVLRVATLLKYHRLHFCVDSIQTVLYRAPQILHFTYVSKRKHPGQPLGIEPIATCSRLLLRLKFTINLPNPLACILVWVMV